MVIDADTGQVLFAKKPDLKRPPASTTKIMTAILLMEKVKPDTQIMASVKAKHTGGSALNLVQGEHLSAHDMLYALMLRSANDGCVAVAEHIAGTEAKFAQMMTAKAKEIGCTNTVFHNANGLNENPNVTTARDLALMAQYASRYPEFNEAIRTKFYKVTRSQTSKDVLIKNHDKFLWTFPGADGVKTGFTNPAGHCFVGSATWNGWRLISVVLNSPEWQVETARLLKYGFFNYDAVKLASAGQVCGQVPVKNGQSAEVPAIAKDTLKFVVPKGRGASITMTPRFDAVTAPVKQGAPLGELEAFEDGKKIGQTTLVAGSDVNSIAAPMGGSLSPAYLVMALIGTVVVGYGTALTKTARRRGYRLKAILRGANRRR